MDVNDLLKRSQGDDEPPMNAAMEDCLAMAGLDAESRIAMIATWVQLGAEYLAREAGRSRAREIIQNTDRFVRDAQPSRPWLR